jgi:cobaltochelatase CobN
MWQWLAPQLDAADAQALGITLAKARGELVAAAPAGTSARQAARPNQSANAPTTAPEPPPEAETAPAARYYELQALADPASAAQRTLPVLALLASAFALFGFGLWRGRQGPALTSGEIHV